VYKIKEIPHLCIIFNCVSSLCVRTRLLKKTCLVFFSRRPCASVSLSNRRHNCVSPLVHLNSSTMGWNHIPFLVFGCDITQFVTVDDAGRTWFNGRQWSGADWGYGDDMYPTAYLEKSKTDEEKYGSAVEPYSEPCIHCSRGSDGPSHQTSIHTCA